MKIAITVDPEIPVPPVLYGGIERIVDMLVRGLVDRGHDVTLFAHPDSAVPCRLVPYPGLRSRSPTDLVRNMARVSTELLRGKYDLVHSFARLAYLLPLLPLPIPKLMSYQRSIAPASVLWGERLSHGTLHFTGCSRWLIEPWARRSNWHVVYNAAPTRAYTFQPQVASDAPLVFLGRIERIKGPHLAIAVAREANVPLVLAGNVPEDPEAQAYFRQEILPYVDGQAVRYLGSVDDEQKNELLGRASALLMPVQWDEPFGIVMVEALACGTPVIGLARGAVPEVVRQGVTGYVCATVDEMVPSVPLVADISRAACRRAMETQFSDEVMVDQYTAIYRSLRGPYP